MNVRGIAILFTIWLLCGAVLLLAVATDGGDYPPAPVELRWQDYRDHRVEGWQHIREAQEAQQR